MAITPDQVAFYRDNGYVTIEGVFDQAAVDAMQEVTEAFIERAKHVTESDGVLDLGPGHSAESPQLRRIKDPEKQHRVYSDALNDPSVLEILAYLIGPNIRFGSSKLNLKEPGGPVAVEWHQDWAYGARTNDDLLTVSIPLNDMTVANGCLMVIPGSHRGKIWNHFQGHEFVGAVTDPDFDTSAALPIELRAGGVSIHHYRMLHGSGPNTSSIPRRLLLFSYAAADAWPLTGVTDFHAFDAMMVRGTAPRAPRLERVPVAPDPRWDRIGIKSLFEVQDKLEDARYRQG